MECKKRLDKRVFWKIQRMEMRETERQENMNRVKESVAKMCPMIPEQ